MNWKKLIPIGAAVCSLFSASLQAQSTVFTYQGRLDDGGSPANGSYDLTFALFSASSGAGQLGSTLIKSATSVSNGLFTVALDFGNQFPGADRWLELGVRTNGAPVFVTLAPRQPVTPTPYAITAGGISGTVAAANLTGSVPSAALTAVPAGSLTGTVGDVRLSANVALRLGGNAFSGDQTISGNVGVGTVSPSAKLDVVGAANFSGNVGIGTTTPNANLEILSSSTAEFLATAHGLPLIVGQKANGSPASPTAVLSGDDLVWFGARGHTGSGFSGTRAALIMKASENWTGSANGVDMLFATALNGTTTRTERMRIANNGFVGIGTATPVASLQVSGSNPQIYVTGNSGGFAQIIGMSANGSPGTPTAVTSGQDLVWFGAQGHDGVSYSATRAAMIVKASQNWTSSAHGTDLLLATTANNTTTRTERMRVTEAGSVGIGTTAPTAKLDVVGDLHVQDPAATTGSVYVGDRSAGGSPKLVVFGDGDFVHVGENGADDTLELKGSKISMVANSVGIGTTSPDALLSVNGTASKPGGGSWSTFSDRRLKDVGDSFDRGLEALGKIQPVHYHYKRGNPLALPSQPDHIGVIAQQVDEAIPEAVERTPDGHLVVNNDPIIWTMFNAIKELNQKVEAKEARLRKQAAENSELKARLERLESLLNAQTGASK